MAVPAVEVVLVLESVGVPVAELETALLVQTAVVQELRAGVLALASVAALAAGPVLLRVAAPQVAPVVVDQALQVDREVFPVVRVLAPAADRAVIQLGALPVAPVVVPASPADRQVAPMVSVAALPAARRVVPPAARAEARLEVRVAAVALQRVQAMARATVQAGAALVAGQAAAAPVVDRVVVDRRVDQPAAAPDSAVTDRVI
jgi:hypothetical protein